MQFQCRFRIVRAAAVMALAACAWLAPNNRALADCQPDITTNLIVNCTAAGGTQTTTVGTGAESDRILTVQPGALIDVSPGGLGVLLDSRNIITNSGTILTGDAAGGLAGGIFLIGDDNVVINNGSIRVGDSGVGGFIFGIQVFGDRASVTNNNSIVVGNGDSTALFSGAFGSAVGISVGNSSQVVNNSSITTGNFANAIFVCCSNTVINSASGLIQIGDDSVGIIASDSNTVTNAGQIVVGNGVNYFSIGIMLSGTNSTATNTGTIRGGNFSIGMAVDDTIYGGGGTLTGNTLINAASGVIQLGASSVGIAALEDGSTVQNFGMISVGALGRGVVAGGDNSTVTNSGTIIAGAGGTGIDIIAPFSGPAGAAGTAVINSGMVIVGTGGIGVNFQDTGSLNNTGIIRAPGLGSIAINTCACVIGVVTNSGTIDGQIILGVGSSVTNSGLITVTDTDATNPAGGFAHIAGETFAQTATGTLALRVTADGRNDSLGTASVTSTVTLAGTLRALVQPGLYGNATTYINVVTSGANIATQFDSVTSSSPFFAATAVYNPASVDLNLARIPFGSVPGMTPNQRAVGNALEGSYSTTLAGNAATFYGNLLAATSVTVLDQLSGEGTSAAQNAAFNAGSLFNNALQGRALFGPNLNGLGAIVPTAYAAERVAPGHEAFAALRPPSAAEPGRFRVWTAGFGASQSLQGQADTGSASQSVRSAGGVLGFDWQAAPDLRIGMAVGGSESTFSVASLSTSGRMTAGHIGAYGMKTWGAYYIAASLSYARLDNSTTRTITGVGPTETVSGRFDSDLLSGRVELGWKQAYGRVNVTPFVAVEPSVVWQRGFTESGTGILGLSVASHTATSLPTFVGVQFDGRYVTPEGAVLAPYSRVSWVHEFEPDRRVSAAFITVPGASFTVNGARAASDAARLDTGAKLTFSGGLALFANFTGEWSDHTHSYAGSGGFRYAW
jgi:uncharacterized protein with beta-barrel porin domain